MEGRNRGVSSTIRWQFSPGPHPEMARRQLIAAGHTEDGVRGAWNYARSAGYTESTGLGVDRLTAAGRSRASSLEEPR